MRRREIEQEIMMKSFRVPDFNTTTLTLLNRNDFNKNAPEVRKKPKALVETKKKNVIIVENTIETFLFSRTCIFSHEHYFQHKY